MRIPNFSALRSFEAAARHGGFTAAAAELNVSQSAVSQQVRLLEQELGTRLFLRNGPRVVLTPAGMALREGLSAGFAQIGRAVERARERARSVVTVSLLPTFAVRWLIPRLERFSAAHEDIDIRLSTSVAPRLPDGNDLDAAIRQESPAGGPYSVDFLIEDEMFPVCRPGFLGREGESVSAALHKATLLHVDAPQRRDDWATWLAGAGMSGIDSRAGVRFENSTQAIQAALSGIGVAIGHKPFVMDDIRAGQLEAPFDHVTAGGADFTLVCSEAGLARPAVQAFRRWMVGEAAGVAGRRQ